MKISNKYMKNGMTSKNLNVAAYYNVLLIFEEGSKYINIFRICGIMQHIDINSRTRYCVQNEDKFYSLGLNTKGFSRDLFKTTN